MVRAVLSPLCAVALTAAAGAAEAQAGRHRAAAPEPAQHWNLTAASPLRAGIYGRVALRPTAPPPPVIFGHPLVATSGKRVPATAAPVYLYVPPGQVRRWAQHCHKWQACDQPVLFVRMDASPSRWGEWRQLREQFAAQHAD